MARIFLLGYLALSACAPRPSQTRPLSGTAEEATQTPGGAQRDLEACFAREPRSRCSVGYQSCVEAADSARWGAAHIELIGCYEQAPSGWRLTDKTIFQGEAFLFRAIATARGIGCYFYSEAIWASLAPDARDLAKSWAGCTEMLEYDPF